MIERQYLDPEHQLDKWVRRFVRYGQRTDTGELLMTLTYAIKESFTYAKRFERGTQDPLLTLNSGKGTCRDFAVLMMEAVRALGFAARFVSGYLYVPSDRSEEHVGGGNTHAWCQVYLPGAGWVEFDPTNGIVGNRDLIRVAVARDPRQAIPLQGSYFGAAADYVGMSVSVDVREVDPSGSDARRPESRSVERSHDGASMGRQTRIPRPPTRCNAPDVIHSARRARGTERRVGYYASSRCFKIPFRLFGSMP